MVLTRKNLTAGRALRPDSFPFETDEKTGCHGMKIGYCSNCNEKLIVLTGEMHLIANEFARNLEEYKKAFKKLVGEEKESLLVKFAKHILNKKEHKKGFEYHGLD